MVEVSASGVRMTGASLTAVISRLKLSDTFAVPSLAVTVIAIVPWKLIGGWPVNRRVALSKASQDGNGFPPAKVAE